jgi:hypothetical protein
MTNDPGDRHVIAAAVKCGAEAIAHSTYGTFPTLRSTLGISKLSIQMSFSFTFTT